MCVERAQWCRLACHKIATYRAPPCLMLGGIPPASLSEGWRIADILWGEPPRNFSQHWSTNAANYRRLQHWHFIEWKYLGLIESLLTHWGRVTHVCTNKLTTNGSDNGLSPGQCQAIIWTNSAIPQCVNFNIPWLTHWGRATHICVSKLAIIGSDNGLLPGRHQAIVWTSDEVLLIWPLGTNFSDIFSKIHTFSFKKMYLKTSSAKWRPFCIGLNVLTLEIKFSYSYTSGCWNRNIPK